MRSRQKKNNPPTPVDEDDLLEDTDDGPSISDEEVEAPPSDRWAKLRKVASEFRSFRPASEVLTKVRAVPTIFPQYDYGTKVGGHPIERVTLVHGPSGEGKALHAETPVLTPSGWVPIGELQVGDLVVAPDGSATEVLGVYPQGKKPLFKVTFDDQTFVECCEEHLWFTTTLKERNRGRYVRGPRPKRERLPTGVEGHGSVKSLHEIRQNFVPHQHAIPIVAPVEFKSRGDLPIDPYLLGLYLGDGCSAGTVMTFEKPEEDLLKEFASRLPDGDTAVEYGLGIRVRGNGLRQLLTKLELRGKRSWEKSVPDLYKFASIEDRLALLRGLLDTDGSVVHTGAAVEYASVSFQLANDVAEIARSLGAYVTEESRHTSYSYRGEKKLGRPSRRLRIYFDNGIVPIASKKHLAKWKGRDRRQLRSIVSIEPSQIAPAVCIRVDHPSRQFVVKDFIVTHNTYFTLGLIKSFLIGDHPAALIDAERTTPRDWVKMCLGEYLHHPFFFADRPKTYEKTVENVRKFTNDVKRLRDDGKIDDDTSAIIVVDSIRKLVPEDQFKRIMEAAKNAKGKKEKLRDRSAQIKAAMNSAWMDELVPLLEETQTSMVIIARETEDPDADQMAKMFGQAFKIGGGAALFYDASLVVRVERAKYVGQKENEEDEKSKSLVFGERHKVTIRKTKIAGKEDRQTVCYYHTSNGKLVPPGFDRPRDILELARKFEIVEGTTWLKFGKSKSGVLGQGEHNAVKTLHKKPELLAEIEQKVRERFKVTDDGEVLEE